jgi:predicted NBD/HSP70 family sugar kinase
MAQRKTNTSEIRKINRSVVFQYLYHHPHTTKQELALGCELSMPTVTLNLADLGSMDLMETTGVKDSTGGRKARLLSVNSFARYAVGANITAHHISAVLLNLYGEMVSHKRIRIPFANSAEYMQTLSSFIWELIREHGIDKQRILGVGLSMPAIISKDGQTLAYASVLNFTNGRLQDFSGPIGLNCRFINDATAGGYAELWHNPLFSTPGDHRAVVYLSLNNSIGGAFFLDDKEYAGMNQRSSEFGHMTLHPDGKTCYCGKAGCSDAYLRALRLSNPYDGNLAAFFEQLRRGDPDALTLWSEYRADLVRCVNNLRMAYDCQVILGGYVGEYLAPYLGELRELAAEKNTFEKDGDYLFVSTDKLENSAVGAALTWITDYIQTV